MELTKAQETLLGILKGMRQRDKDITEDDIVGIMLTVKTTEQIEELFDFIKEKEEKHQLTIDSLIRKALQIAKWQNSEL